MFGRIFSAIGNLASSIEALAATFRRADEMLRERLALDAAAEVPLLPAPEEQETHSNGRRKAKAS